MSFNLMAWVKKKTRASLVLARAKKLLRVRFVLYRRALGCLRGVQAPLFLLLATHCSMKYIPSTPS